MEFTFRRLVAADTPQYRSLRLECLRDFPYHFGADHAEQAALPKLLMETQIEANNDETFAFGAFHNDQLIGICGLMRDAAKRRRHSARLVQMYVQPQYSGRRVGYRLLESLIQAAWEIAELDQLILEVVTSSQNAVYLYGQVGFEQMGFHKDFMKFGNRTEDAYLMILFRDKIRPLERP